MSDASENAQLLRSEAGCFREPWGFGLPEREARAVRASRLFDPEQTYTTGHQFSSGLYS